MNHPRQAIRQAFCAALAGRTVAQGRIWANRPSPLSQGASSPGGLRELPAVLVYTRDERADVFDESPRRYRRRCDVVAECAIQVAPGTAIDDDLDAFAQQVETAVLADDTLGGVAHDTQLTSTTMTIVDTGAQLIGAVVLTFEVEYFTHAPTPDTPVPDALSTLETQYSLDGEQPDPRDRATTLLTDMDQ
jgi:hypothetical protein